MRKKAGNFLVDIFCSFIAISCNPTPVAKAPLVPKDYIYTTFLLEDSIHYVHLYLPKELDTSYTWIDYSDDRCADFRKYRFIRKNFPHIKESGFIFKEREDSSYCLTIKHIAHFECQTPSFDPRESLKITYKKYQEIYGHSIAWLDSASTIINNRQFTTWSMGMNYPDGKKSFYFLHGLTKLDSTDIDFEYKCFSHNCNGFIEHMKISLNTIRIDTLK